MNLIKSLLFLLFLLVFEASAVSEVLDRVIATIGSEPVTSLEVKKILGSKSAGIVEGAPTELDIKEAILIMLFNREASRLGVDVSEEDIDAYIHRVEISNGGGVGNIEEALATKGMTLSAYRAKVRGELEKSRILAMNLRSHVQVSDEEVHRYLGKDEEDHDSDHGFYLVQVNYPKDFDDLEVESIKKYLKDNKKCFSSKEIKAQCINMGEVRVEDLKEEIQDLVEDLELYESNALRNIEMHENGVLYMRVESNFGNESGETFSKIKEQLYQKKFMEKANQFVTKDIFEKYAVEIY